MLGIKGSGKSVKKLELIERRDVSNLREMIDYSCNRFGSRAAFAEKVNGKFEKITYSQYLSDREALESAIEQMGLARKKIALLGEHGYGWALVYSAAVCGGTVIVPLDSELPEAELINLLHRAEVSAVFCGKKRMAELTEIIGAAECEMQLFCIENDLKLLIEQGRKEMRAPGYVPQAEDAASLIFTSGTTGEAKGVLLTHKNICSNITAMTKYVQADENDVFLSVLPPFHVYECTCGFLGPIYLGAEIAFCSGLRHIMRDMRETGATVMLGVPLIFESMYKKIGRTAAKNGQQKKLRAALALKRAAALFRVKLCEKLFAQVREPFGKMRLFISGAAPIDPEIVRFFCDIGIKMQQGYGMTECSPIISLTHFAHIRPRSVGFALDGVEVKIDTGTDGEHGEILVRGENVTDGYYENEAATLEAIHDGWLSTGDMGYIDRDGYLYITGRKKNVIINKNGKNVYPEEIEAYLCRSQYIAECLVSGVFDTKDEDVRIIAQIVPDADACAEAADDDEKLAELIAAEVDKVNSAMQSYKRIVDFKIRKEPFKKTSGNKIKRYVEK